MNSLKLKCDCSCEMLEIERYYEDENDKGFHFALWHMYRDNNMAWPDRLRWAWKILKTGNLWADSIILSDEKTKELGEFINNKLKESNVA